MAQRLIDWGLPASFAGTQEANVAQIVSYETMVILKPSLAKEDTDRLIDKYAEVIKTQGGTVTKIDRMGKRKIAYDMKKQPEGFYCTLQFDSFGPVVAELERQLRISEDILKFMTLKQEPVSAVPVTKPAPATAE